ncbi:hypothetical protein FP2506_16874 [Fulvimarina pelagi HTCC2506]|uniref:Uncharacterized protein n=1 Tax=Fulvimarina pelagi HTCC2506 TaxID=314231 RepID=Q0G2Q5_9HYPH|nr:hypothetical protein FP2506_16874 [Fulvimarina pelagi HTCC2506]
MTPAAAGQRKFRPGTDTDDAQIRALVRAEVLNAAGLSWSNFVVATCGDDLIGAA